MMNFRDMLLQKNIFQSSLEHWLFNKNSGKEVSVNIVFNNNISIGSSIGLVRKENQDKAVIAKFCSRQSKNKFYILFALSDGMGGMKEGGKCASLLLSTFLSELVECNENIPFKKLCNASSIANQAIFEKYNGSGGATLSAILLDSHGSSSAINVGDSRIYQLDRNGIFKQISVDDTIDGQLSAINKEKSEIPSSKQLVQFIGMGDGLEPHEIKLSSREIIKKLILTSDGAHCVGDAILGSLLENAPENKIFLFRSLALANWLGGKDNATSICLSFDSIKELFEKDKRSEQLIQVWNSDGKYDFPNYLYQGDIQNIAAGKVPQQLEVNPKYSEGVEAKIIKSQSYEKDVVRGKTKNTIARKSKPQNNNKKKSTNVQIEIIDFIKKEDTE
jgi:PPM family protein phosphatase